MKNKRVIVCLDCGLGNQMFVYTFAKFLQQQGYTIGFDISAYGGGIM